MEQSPKPPSSSNWDFAPVHSLIKSFANDVSTAQRQPALDTNLAESAQDGLQSMTSGLNPVENDITGATHLLGDFSKIWDRLGVRHDVPAPRVVPTFEASITVGRRNLDAYASDSAMNYPPSSRRVSHKAVEEEVEQSETDYANQTSGAENNRSNGMPSVQEARAALAAAMKARKDKVKSMAAMTSESEYEPPTSSKNATKNKKKKEKKKAKKKLTRSMSVNASAPDLTRLTGAKATSENEVTSNKQSTETKPLLEKMENLKVSPASQTVKTDILESVQSEWQSKPKTSDYIKFVPPTSTLVVDSSNSFLIEELNRSSNIERQGTKDYTSTPAKIEQTTKQFNGQGVPDPMKENPAVKAAQAGTTKYAFAQGGDSTFDQRLQPTAAKFVPNPRNKPGSARHEIRPKVPRDNTSRNWDLLLRLLHTFPQERMYLLSPLQMTMQNSENGIHVFVDASNIFIGFMELLKAERGIPAHARVPRVHINFPALALLLERRRPVAKRVLAGSKPEIPAYEQARQVGYETCILDPVQKTGDPVEGSEKRSLPPSNSSRTTTNLPLRPDYAPPLPANFTSTHHNSDRPRWVEQGVDELLHLKMLESLLDVPPPSASSPLPTMVLATGDANAAQHSPGFMKMIERALHRGWAVEVAAWRASVSGLYRRLAQTPFERGGWGERFRLVELDGFEEELFDVDG